jgi:hypothetical protein
MEDTNKISRPVTMGGADVDQAPRDKKFVPMSQGMIQRRKTKQSSTYLRRED